MRFLNSIKSESRYQTLIIKDCNQKILDLINKVHARENLSYEESQYCMREIMSGNILPSQFGALMSAMALKEETPTELAGMASIMREYSLKIKSKENSNDKQNRPTKKQLNKQISCISY